MPSKTYLVCCHHLSVCVNNVFDVLESDPCDKDTATSNGTQLASLWGKLRQWAG